jgi:hypothetical protein
MDLQVVKWGGMDCIDLPQVMDRKNGMGEARSMYGREESCAEGFHGET